MDKKIKLQKTSFFSKRRAMRETVFQLIFSNDFIGLENEQEIEKMFFVIESETKYPLESVKEEVIRYCTLILQKKEEIDRIIKQFLFNWSWERVSEVDKNILRLAVYELIFESKVPVEVTLNEAIEISKKFGSEKSSKFVNGVLDSIAKERVPREKLVL
jgi:N utilization substance protein B